MPKVVQRATNTPSSTSSTSPSNQPSQHAPAAPPYNSGQAPDTAAAAAVGRHHAGLHEGFHTASLVLPQPVGMATFAAFVAHMARTPGGVHLQC